MASSSVLLTVLLGVNAVAALVSSGSALAGMLRPGLALASGEAVTGGVRFYASAYALRAVPLGLLTAALAVVGDRPALVPVLVVAGLVQVGDSTLGARRRHLGMAFGAGLFAALHLATALWLSIR
ncbi:hypothetical protein [Streptacidiphilus jiangxiensis]|uniref:DUF4267 domain-containing protein n=1 Tax=Streptacidiphilus jiangxiensis TaxID=235985 RepID=A0A1H7KSI5_STRJI|nr:hypothetical protein [Streptacidiphilus jiangxiensis]SEK89015.1 hypothetical protein SAMN05414137_104157 [Streptacidiphilus jiangxiensis]